MSPVVLPPVSTAYCSLSRAPPPVSVMYQPVGSAVFVVLPAVLESVSKFSVAAVPSAVSETLPVPVSSGGPTTLGATTPVLGGAAVMSFLVTCAAAKRKGCIRTKAAVTAARSWRRAGAECRLLRGEVNTWVKSFLGLKLRGRRPLPSARARAERLRRKVFIG